MAALAAPAASVARWSRVRHTEGDVPWPDARCGHVSAVVTVDHVPHMFLFGGYNDDGFCSPRVWLFNLETLEWREARTELYPLPRSGASCAVYGEYVVLFGGFVNNHTNELLLFHVSTMQWILACPRGQALPPGFGDSADDDDATAPAPVVYQEGDRPSQRDKVTSCVVGDTVYFFGGWGCQHDIPDKQFDADPTSAFGCGWNNQLFALDLSQLNAAGERTVTWTQPPTAGTPPQARAAHSMTLVPAANKAVVIGGRTVEGRQNDVHVLDFGTVPPTWTQVDIDVSHAMPLRRSWQVATSLHDGTIFTYGGLSMAPEPGSTQGEVLGDAWVLDLGERRWTPVVAPVDADTGAPLVSQWHTAITCPTSGAVYVFAGASNSEFRNLTCHARLLRWTKEVPSLQRLCAETVQKHPHVSKDLHARVPPSVVQPVQELVRAAHEKLEPLPVSLAPREQ